MISRLKSLELQGYKTFASRTVFEFPGAVTAIVGPNGSGKSNITDALRWVLGEQSYSLLRGKKTEDMIFSGSDRRTRSGMASATIILDNSDNWLPIDFAEVAIARRAYRDGSNEYLLNGQRVRLKDVSELLSESGLAERTYTIIGQGLVDAALALRAEDRRRLFEEAAGIGLHRSRRQEAVRRLSDTQRNLERVEDILTELRPRLRSLERQASRAQEYEHAVSELRAILREWYGYHWHRAQEKLSQSQNITKELAEVLEKTRSKESELDKDITRLREQRQEVRGLLTKHNLKLADLHTRRENASRELAVAEEREHSLREQVNRSQVELTQTDEDMSIREKRKTLIEEELQKLNAELDDAKKQEISAKAAFESRQSERQNIELQLVEDNQLIVELTTHQTEVKSRNVERQGQLDDIQSELIITKKSMDEELLRSKQLDVDVEKSKEEIASAESLLKEIETAKNSAEEKIAENYKELTKKEKQLLNLEKELSRLSAKYEVIEQAENKFIGYATGTKTLMEKLERIPQKDGKEILGSSLIVPEKYEMAVEAILGDYIDGLILNEYSQVESALTILEQNSENAILIPLYDLLSFGSSIDFPDREGIEGTASELISTSEEVRPALELLLGNVLVVENRNIAMRIVKDLRSTPIQNLYPEPRIVTLAGEVFHLHGPIKTRSSAKPRRISRPRERRDIRNKIIEVEEEVEIQKKDIEELSTVIASLRDEKDSLESEYGSRNQSIEKIVTAHRQLLFDDEQAKRELDWRENHHFELLSTIERDQKQIQSSIDELKMIEQNQSEIHDRISHQKAALKDLPIEKLQADLAHWTTRVAVLEQALEGAQNRLTERVQGIEDTVTKSELIIDRIKELKDEQNQLAAEIENLRGVNEDILVEIDEVRELLIPNEHELEIFEQKMTELLSLESKERVISNQAEQNYTQARINQVRKQEALDRLRRQIEADFGLVSFEYREDVSGPTPLPLEGIVEDLPLLTELPEETEDALKRQRAFLRRIGPISPEALNEFNEVQERYNFLISQVNDLQEAASDVERVIEELDEIMQREFCNTFDAVAEEFHQIFGRLFGGGSARLVLTDPNDLTETGIDIEARLPGRREQGLSLLSGGERSLTAVALVFALLRISPTPFCVLDEVDAMLDEANVGRFRELLRELSHSTQFIMITHNRATVQVADIIYGVTMGRDSTSKILSLKVDELEKVV
jgi:chromosome segregation protein